MAKYLVEVNYTKEGLQGVLKEGGSKRREAATKAVENAGGKVEVFYFAFGRYDAVVIADLPDNVSAAALSMAIGASGSVEFVTTPLLTSAEIDEAVTKKVGYRAPGQ